MASKRAPKAAIRKLIAAAGPEIIARKMEKRKRPVPAVMQIAVPTGRARYEQQHRYEPKETTNADRS